MNAPSVGRDFATEHAIAEAVAALAGLLEATKRGLSTRTHRRDQALGLVRLAEKIGGFQIEVKEIHGDLRFTSSAGFRGPSDGDDQRA